MSLAQWQVSLLTGAPHCVEYPLKLFIALLLGKSSSVVPFSAQSTGFQIGRLNHSFWMPCFTEGKTIASPIGLWPKQL